MVCCAETLILEPPEGEHPLGKLFYLQHHAQILRRIGRVALAELVAGFG